MMWYWKSFSFYCIFLKELDVKLNETLESWHLGKVLTPRACKYAAVWFANYISNRTQCFQVTWIVSSFLDFTKVVHQGSVLGPIWFSIYISMQVTQVFEFLQAAFNVIWSRLNYLKLDIDTDKSKVHGFFSYKGAATEHYKYCTIPRKTYRACFKLQVLGFFPRWDFI